MDTSIGPNAPRETEVVTEASPTRPLLRPTYGARDSGGSGENAPEVDAVADTTMMDKRDRFFMILLTTDQYLWSLACLRKCPGVTSEEIANRNAKEKK